MQLKSVRVRIILNIKHRYESRAIAQILKWGHSIVQYRRYRWFVYYCNQTEMECHLNIKLFPNTTKWLNVDMCIKNCCPTRMKWRFYQKDCQPTGIERRFDKNTSYPKRMKRRFNESTNPMKYFNTKLLTGQMKWALNPKTLAIN